MRIVIFGATGKMGQILVRKALAEGHTVVAVVRNPDKITFQDANLLIVKATLDDAVAIKDALHGADAVIEGVGSVSEGTRRIVSAMEDLGIKRLVVVSTCSVDDVNDLPDIKRKALVAFVKTAVPGPYAEVRKAAEIVRASQLDWTLVRVAKLADKPALGQIKSGYYGRHQVGLSITREDMATFLLSQITDSTYLRAAPAISN